MTSSFYYPEPQVDVQCPTCGEYINPAKPCTTCETIKNCKHELIYDDENGAYCEKCGYAPKQHRCCQCGCIVIGDKSCPCHYYM